MQDEKEEKDPLPTPKKRPSQKSRTRARKRANGKNVKAGTKKNADRAKTQRPFPNRTLEEALQIPEKIKENNSGNPWNTDDAAAASGLSRKSTNFFYLAAAARDYGLTTGSRDTEKIELAELGRKIVYAGDAATLLNAKIESFFKVDLFKRVYTYYGGSTSLPKENQFFYNTLQNEFNLPEELNEEFSKIFVTNCAFLGIENGLGESSLLDQAEAIGSSTEIRVVGQPKGKFDRTAFVIMPFNEHKSPNRPRGFFEEVLESLITPAANSAGFAVETAERSGSDVIQSTIINQLLDAQLVIADLTDHNPNVLFELGIRIAKELPVALIKADGTGQIFDVDGMMRVLPYNPNVWPSTVESDSAKLTDHFKAAWDNRSTSLGYMKILTKS
ncbi:MAG: hypothetical protein WBP29_12725 [Candidatus Zixiibacteriota bacterium]